MKKRIKQIVIGCVLIAGLTFGVNVDLNNQGLVIQQPTIVEAAKYIDVELPVLIESAYRVNDPFLGKNLRVEGPVDYKCIDNGKRWVSIGESGCTANLVIYLNGSAFDGVLEEIKIGQYIRVSGKIVENQAEMAGGYIMSCDTIEY